MPEMIVRLIVMSLTLWVSMAAAETAAPLRVGDALPALPFSDQYEQPHRLDDCSALVLFAPDRPSADLVKEVLAGTDGDAMAERGLCYVADISSMPGIVTRMFALPAMRDYGYPVMLGQEAPATTAMPRRAESVTAIAVGGGRVEAISFAATPEAVRAAIDAHARAPGGE